MGKNKLIKFKSSLLATDQSVNRSEKTLIFSADEKFERILAEDIQERSEFFVYLIRDLDSLVNELIFSQYASIFLDIDSIFDELNKALIKIRNDRSKNKNTLIYLITLDEKKLSVLSEFFRYEKITLINKKKYLLTF